MCDYTSTNPNGRGRGRGDLSPIVVIFQRGETPSVRWTSPPNPTMKIWDENGEFESSDLGETPRWAFPCKSNKYSSFIIQHSSLLFGNDEVVRDVSAVEGRITQMKSEIFVLAPVYNCAYNQP